MSAGFTPGPWEVVTPFESDTRYISARALSGGYVTRIVHSANDARLIAAAPELYEALAAMVADHKAIQCKQWPSFERACAALAKARGETVPA
jgi:hypothetical protein